MDGRLLYTDCDKIGRNTASPSHGLYEKFDDQHLITQSDEL
jgi:hypothetical protein